MAQPGRHRKPPAVPPGAHRRRSPPPEPLDCRVMNQRRIDAERFRKLVLVLLIILGASLIL